MPVWREILQIRNNGLLIPNNGLRIRYNGFEFEFLLALTGLRRFNLLQPVLTFYGVGDTQNVRGADFPSTVFATARENCYYAVNS